jgi:hypothetical protein
MKTIDKEAVEWLVEMDILQPNLQTTETMKTEEEEKLTHLLFVSETSEQLSREFEGERDEEIQMEKELVKFLKYIKEVHVDDYGHLEICDSGDELDPTVERVVKEYMKSKNK